MYWIQRIPNTIQAPNKNKFNGLLLYVHKFPRKGTIRT